MPDHLRSPHGSPDTFVEMAASKEIAISPEVLNAVAMLAPRFTLGDVSDEGLRFSSHPEVDCLFSVCTRFILVVYLVQGTRLRVSVEVNVIIF